MNPLEQLIAEYINYALSIKNHPQLAEPVRSDILGKMASALGTLVPLATQDGQAEQQMAIQKHQAELQMAQEKHQMDMQLSSEKHQAGIIMKQEQAKHKQTSTNNEK